MGKSKEYSDKFQRGLGKMVADMQERLDNPGIYIFECGLSKETTSTQHQILPGNVFDRLSGGISTADWLMDAVNGDIGIYSKEESAWRFCHRKLQKAYPFAQYKLVSGYGHVGYPGEHLDEYCAWLSAAARGGNTI